MSTTEAPQQGGRLGTFAGVFTPSVLTILGIILFLRLGYVVGQAGLGRALIIIAIANGISILTSISLSAVATNLRVGAGGDYYLISRTLGPGFGASIGIVLFLAQAVSIAFYAIGFGEATSAILANYDFAHPQMVAAGAVVVLFVFAWLGSDWATRFQYGVMIALCAGLVSFFIGATEHWDSALLADSWAPAGDLPFWAIFAIFFPAVTGFTQGVSMSGDLADAGKSIPRGTFLAVGISAVVYFAVAVVFAATLPGASLATETDAMWKVSKVSWLADAGVIAATLSSALASFMGAPRILQSLASDRIFPLLSIFAKGSGATNNPRRGVLLSLAIALATIWAGDLNIVAPVVSMFFLISYGLLNYATYVEARSNSPYFRPRFRWFHPRLSLLGAVGCLIAMVALDPTAAAISAAILYAIFQYVDRRSDISRWADGRRSSRFQRIRQELHGIADEMWHPRDWRPVLLVFTNDVARRERLMRFASWIEGGAGFTTVVKLLPGQGARMEREREAAEDELKADIERAEIEAFPLVVATPDLSSGLSVLLQSQGLGPIHPNTVLMNWFDRHPRSDSPPGLESFGTYLQHARRRDCNIVLLEATDEDLSALTQMPGKKRTIDVWFEEDASGPLMLLFAYLMTRDEDWKRARIRLFAAPKPDETHEQTLARLTAMLIDVRIEAYPEVVDNVNERMISTRSAQASIVFLPFRLRGDSLVGGFGVTLSSLLEVLPMSALVLAAQDIDLDARPEEGPHGDIAEAMDAADSYSVVAAKTAKEAVEASEALAKAVKELERARVKNADVESIAALELAHENAAEAHERAVRRAAKAKAKADQAGREAEAVREESED
ncbi:MAG: amino acid permease [Planctomycetes bacterium]|nr:amino acid permease [Planctomycetota bacterium]